jgi:poly(ADP-ribose) glycohydrolase ARH3
MMLGLAESLSANKGFNGEAMTSTLIKNWEREPWRGYGPGPPSVFRMIKRGVSWNEAAKNLYRGAGSYGNGAAMRVAPIGLLYYDDHKKLREVAAKSAELTHTHDLGKEGAALQAYSIALAVQETETLNPSIFLEKLIRFTHSDLYKEKLMKAKRLLCNDDKEKVVKTLGNGIEAFNSVPTAIYSFAKNYYDFTKALRYAISLGGDTDTIGAMTGGIAGAYHGEEQCPKIWVDNLEKADYITGLAQKIWKLKVSFVDDNGKLK